jgi:hypothetical protein
VGGLLSLWSTFALESYLVRRSRRAVRVLGSVSATSRDAQPSGVRG